jgi:hypothetical protein
MAMSLKRSRRAAGVPMIFCRIFGLFGALAVAACNTTSQPGAFVATPQKATIAFDSIDGPPRAVFDKLVQDLNAEAQERRLPVAARDGTAVYRVRGYLGASTSPKQNSVSWVWDVYDREQRRVLRISGEENIAGRQKDVWQAVGDDAMRRIAHKTVDELAGYLAAVERGASVSEVASNDGASPEAAGIFRIPQNVMASQTGPDAAVQKQRAASTSFTVPSEPPSGTN